MKKIILSLALALGFSMNTAFAEPVTYTIEKDHTSIEFYINHLGFSNFQGEFQGFDGTIVFDKDKPENSSVSVTVDMNSVDTNVEELDNNLKGEKLFNVAKYPTMTFKSKSIKVTGENTALITGDLTIIGVTKEMTLDTTLNKAAIHPRMNVPAIGLSAVGKIKRSDFGMTKWIPNIADEISIRIETEAQALKK
ncbi:MAG: polyisoprenoid-binding protein [Methylocystaceae bacterium]|nr:polyisoprenoid-binding protein [Methylocystaceae bacterium]